MSRSDKTEPTSVLSSKEKSVRYKILDYDNLESRNEALNELANYYLEEVYINNEFDSRYQVATAIFEDYKDLKKVLVKFDVINLEDMNYDQISAFIGATNINFNTSDKKEYLWHQCVGGKNDSKTLVLERPTGIGSAASYGKKVADFAAECLDAGGCIEVCKYTNSVKANTENINFENESDREEYEEMLNNTQEILQNKLESISIL